MRKKLLFRGCLKTEALFSDFFRTNVQIFASDRAEKQEYPASRDTLIKLSQELIHLV